MVFYNNAKCMFQDPRFGSLGEPPFELLLDIIRISLMKTTYSINIDTHIDFADISASEIVATGYGARGDGIQLGSKAVAVDLTNDRSEFDAADHVYVAIGGASNDTFDQIVGMREQDAGATDANTLLLAHAAVASTTTNGGDITLQFNAEGFLHLT